MGRAGQEPPLTVSVSKHNAGALPAQLQGHPLEVAFPGSFFDQLANLKRGVTKELVYAALVRF